MERGCSIRGSFKPPVCLQFSHWRREGGWELSLCKDRQRCAEGWGGAGKKAPEQQWGAGGHWSPWIHTSVGLHEGAVFPATPTLLLVRLQAWLSERLQQKLMHGKGSVVPPSPPSLLWGAEAWRARSYLYR